MRPKRRSHSRLTLLAMALSLASTPLSAQTLSFGIVPNLSDYSISKPILTPQLNAVQESLVVVKAQDASIMQIHEGKLSVGSNQRDGQGVIIDPTGIIATNIHVVGEHPEHVSVTLHDGQTFEAKVIHQGTPDLALIQIQPNHPLRSLPIADTSSLIVGNKITAFPKNDNSTILKEVKGQIKELYTEISTNKIAIIEFNAALQNGDSGGPVINESGQLIGLIMANQKSEPLRSYAISAEKIQTEYAQYKASTTLARI